MIGKEHLVKQFTLALVGTFIAAVGIRLIVVSGLGADAISTLVLGLMQHIPFRFGTLSLLFNAIVLVIIFFYDRRMIGIGSVINGFGVGICLNLIEAAGLLHTIPQVLEYPSILAGTIIFGIGTGIYLLANAGSAAYESLMIILQRVLKVSVKTARIILDGSFFLVGYLLGGTVGLGTIIVLVLMGPSLEFTLNHFPKLKLFRVRRVN
ncbi:YitT family protein [Enterococcus sp. 669A]|uniref:YitT family protein n=1 Tax=Candidatus Enterococcus moelleringii TaxID=2815325 RepID=A0ABS3LD77_9ENTE|nr:YitT family protein [Enterococcus sp. 669A]MBO1307584.1 YitT family protein [Enterococcus sp. 669A]